VIGGQEVAPITMAASFATFASGGIYCKPIALESVKDAQGKEYEVPKESCKRAISKDVANAVTIPLENLVSDSPGYMRPMGFPAAAKTGTTDVSEQTWTVGYTTGLATASWVGNWTSYDSLNNVPINGVTRDYVDGATIAGAQWTEYMMEVAPLYETNAFENPPNSIVNPSQSQPSQSQNSGGGSGNGGSNNDGGSDHRGNGNNGRGNGGNGNGNGGGNDDD
jgi:membrane peptidoglycan carboxypeptidase